MRLEGRKRLGYFPLPVEHCPSIRARLAFPDQPISALDPCAGTGAALKAITVDSGADLFGIELDADRAASAKSAGFAMIHGNIFDVRARVERLSLLYLNPPYDFEIGPLANQRMERLFLQHTFSWLKPKGVLVMVIPGKAVLNVADLLSARFKDVHLYRMDGTESRQYDQYAVFGIRHNNSGRDAEAINSALRKELQFTSTVPALTLVPDVLYQVPPTTLDVDLTYTGIPLDEVEDRIIESVAWRQAAAVLLPKEEVDGGQPITPLHGGHVGLLATAGMLNGVFGSGEQEHIARWRPVKHTTTMTEVENGAKIVRTKERFSNELALVFVTGQTMILNETKKEEVAVPADSASVYEEPVTLLPEPADDGVRPAEAGGLFRLGRVSVSAGVEDFVQYHDLELSSYLARHQSGDWGEDLSLFDRRRNEEAVNSGDGRVLSSFTIAESPEGKIWVFTAPDRSTTTICLPSEM